MDQKNEAERNLAWAGGVMDGYDHCDNRNHDDLD